MHDLQLIILKNSLFILNKHKSLSMRFDFQRTSAAENINKKELIFILKAESMLKMSQLF
jgi:hypothetical protein